MAPPPNSRPTKRWRASGSKFDSVGGSYNPRKASASSYFQYLARTSPPRFWHRVLVAIHLATNREAKIRCQVVANLRLANMRFR